MNTPILTEVAKVELEQRLRSAKNHAVRMRCQTVLLKAEGQPSEEVASIVKMCGMSVNNWLNRYKANGINGLLTKPAGGRKKLIFSQQENGSALELIKANRQRLQTGTPGRAKAEWEAQQGKSMGRDSFRRFLKVLVGTPKRDGTNGFANE